MTTRPYLYVASSWRNPAYPEVITALQEAGVDHYDFRNPPTSTAFSWHQVGGQALSGAPSQPEPVANYIAMIQHPVAQHGFLADMKALSAATHVALILPCGRSAHLELGWAVGAGKHTAILLEDPMEPELMYRMVDYLATTVESLLEWIAA